MNIETIQDLLNLNVVQAQFAVAGGVLVLAFSAYFISKKILMKVILKFSRKTKTLWDDKLVERKVFDKLNVIIPLMIIYFSAYLFPVLQIFLKRISKAGIVWYTILAASALLSAVNDIYLTTRRAENKPIKGFADRKSADLFQ